MKLFQVLLIHLIFTVFITPPSFGQEVVSPLPYNPHLFQSWKSIDNKRLMADRDFLFIPNTLLLPFSDDFSKNYLRKLDPEPFIIGQVLRSVQLGKNVDTLRAMLSPSYFYFLTNGNLDSTAYPPQQLILNNSLRDPFLSTDTLDFWPQAFEIIFDNAGNRIDSVAQDPDTTLLYTLFQVVRDSTSRWMDNQVYVNHQLMTNPLSYGVATFDGLNAFGLPYDNTTFNRFGPADTLTSQWIDLSNLSPGDSLYFSFAYQPQGLGDFPNIGDSLVLEFKISEEVWAKQWGVNGFLAEIENPEFVKVSLPVTDPFFFTNEFQFRFRNYATISGNNDHWHIDYVYLNANRSITDTIIQDVAVLNPPTGILSRYLSMPWNQFEGFESTEAKAEFSVSYKNNFGVNQPLDFSYRVSEDFSGTPLFQEVTFNFPVFPFSSYSQLFPTAPFIPINAAPTNDSLTVNVTTYINPIGANIAPENDTVSALTLFQNYLAYDDGSAEKAYGLEGAGLKKFAYRFNLNRPDTLRAVLIHFTTIQNSPFNLLFSLYVWKNIDLTNSEVPDEVLYFDDFRRPQYVDRRNGFAVFVLDTPLIIDGSFFVGFQQVENRNIQIGLDVNHDARQNMFIEANGTWRGSQVKGAPMIRPLLGKAVPLINTGVSPKNTLAFTEWDATLYPNPVQHILRIQPSDVIGSFHATVIDMQGRRCWNGTWPESGLQVDFLAPGMYVLKLEHAKGVKMLRFIKSNH